jgi:raffinose/stachyose/melibiose transport system permease protein
MTTTSSKTPAVDNRAAGGSARPPGPTRKNRVDPAYYVMLIPVVILFTLFITLPAVIGMFYSFTNYVGYGTWKFIGLTNYTSLFSDPNIRHAYGFTLLFSFVTVVAVNAIALALAIGLSGKIKFKTSLRGIFFIPMVISGIVIAYVFSYLFSTSIPAIATSLGIDAWTTSILASPHWAWVAVVIVATWQSVPGAMIIYLAGLLSIPDEVYEAASIDGANSWRQFRSITFPLVAGYVVINTILGVKAYLNVYDIIIGTTNGGPGTSTQSVAMTIFTGLYSGDYAYQMANAVIFFLVTVLISLLQLQLIRRRGVAI